MRKPNLSSIVSATFLALAGCGGNALVPSDAGAGDATSHVPIASLPGATPLPCDVDQVLQKHCRTCHQNPPLSGAPMPLMTWQDLQGPAHSDPTAHVYERVEARIHDNTNPMPQPPNARLGAADLATLDQWVSAGAPAGSAACVGDAEAPLPDAAPPAVSCNSDNVKLVPSQPWAMPTTDDDDYVCYGVQLPTTAGTNHVMSITPNVVNSKIVHHVLLFQSSSPLSTVPAKCSAAGSLAWRIVYAWAPGGEALKTPPNVGFPYDATTNWIVQVHYNNVNHLAGETDTSGFSFCSTDQAVQYDADVMAFGTLDINIQPLQTLDETCTYTLPSEFEGIHVFSAFPHMHQLGTAIETVQRTAGGGIVGLGKNDPWSFTNQLWFQLDATLHAGDQVSTRCAWQNSTNKAVTFGQNTENEMCYSFTAYYPAVALSNWGQPAESGSCTKNAGPLPTPDAGW